MEKAQKERVVKELNQVFNENTTVLLIDFTGISVAEETSLRRQLLESGSSYRVVKNRLALRAAVETPVDRLIEHFQGPTAIALNKEDPVALAKILSAFVKEHPQMTVKVGVVEREVVSPQQITALATMPSREELLSKLVFLLLAPLQNMVTALQSPVRNLASVLSQIESSGKKAN